MAPSDETPMIGIFVQARFNSRRLPGKALFPIDGVPMVVHVLRAAHAAVMPCRARRRVLLVTGTDPLNDRLVDVAHRYGFRASFRGSDTDVLKRFRDAMDTVGADIVVRLTGDCPLVPARLIERAVSMLVADRGLDGVITTPDCGWPDGFDVEVLRSDIVRRSDEQATSPSEREHVTLWARAHGQIGRIYPKPVKLSVDDWEDYERVVAHARGAKLWEDFV